jgi:hypothetical protein
MSRSPDKLALPPPPPPPPSRTVVVALSGSSKSKYVVTWAIEKFATEGNVGFKLLHIHPMITSVPTPSKVPTMPCISVSFFLVLRTSSCVSLFSIWYCCVKQNQDLL